MLIYQVLADVVVAIHFTYVAFVVFGMVAILIGLAFGRSWARGFWFRILHLLAIAVVALQALCGVVCPLTILESHLRRLGGQEPHPGAFIGYWAHRLIFFHAPAWAFTVVYVSFGLLVLAVIVLAPPRMPRWLGGRAGTLEVPRR